MLLALAILVANANGLRGGFFGDDASGIAANPAIRSLANIPRFFADPSTLSPVKEHVDIRPVVVTTFAINHAISGLDPWSWHALSLLLHFVSSFLVFVIVRDHAWWPVEERGAHGQARWPAAACALLFALAPLTTQALVDTWARPMLLGTTLCLGAFLAFARGRHGIAAMLHALALLSSPVALSLPVLILTREWILRDRSRHPGLRAWLGDMGRLARPVGMLVALSVASLAQRAFMLDASQGDGLRATWGTPDAALLSAAAAAMQHVRLFLWPSGLAADHGSPTPSVFGDDWASGTLLLWLPLLILLAWSVFVAWLARRNPLPAFATAWFFVALVTEMPFISRSAAFADQRAYLASSLGLALLLVAAAWQLARRFAGNAAHRAFAGATLALCMATLPVSWYRNWQWGEAERLWRSTTRVSPGNSRAWTHLGRQLMDRGASDEARASLERALALDVSNETAKSALASLQIQSVAAMPADARPQVMPQDMPQAMTVDELMQQAVKALRAKDWQVAVGPLRAVLAMSPSHYGATYQLAAALDHLGQRDEAVTYWKAVLPMAEKYHDAETAATARQRLDGIK